MASPKLNTKDIRNIEGLLQGWTTKLTWCLLVERIETDFNIKISRQALKTYASIYTMYQDRKQVLRGKPTESLTKFTKNDISRATQIEHLNSQLEALSKRVERQHAFISEIAEVAKTNPLMMDVIEKVKLKISRNGHSN